MVYVPSGVEFPALERLDPGDIGQLRPVQRTGTNNQKLGNDLVPTIRFANPATALVVPDEALGLGVEEGQWRQVPFGGDPGDVLGDFGGSAVPFTRNVLGQFQQW